jgi:SNF2 family DNA or RNA helicase
MEQYTKRAASRNRAPDMQEMMKQFPFLSPQSKFHRIILDEAQAIKNLNSKRSKAIHQIVATYRWCLTGTPMMNDPMELGSLIKFLRIKPYCDENLFKSDFASLSRRSSPRGRHGYRGYTLSAEEALKKLKELSNLVMLRRTKETKMRDGQPIVKLPPKIEMVDYVTFSPEEETYYRDLEKTSQIKLKAFVRSGLHGKAITMALVLLLRLRQACCHPFLNVGQLEWVGADEIALNSMMEQVRPLNPEAVEHLRGNTSFECAACIDTTDKPIIVPNCGHTICSACFDHMKLSAEEKGETKQEEEEVDYTAGCPKCEASFDLQKAATYHAFKKVYVADTDNTSGDKINDDNEGKPDHQKYPKDRLPDPDDEDEVDEADERGNLRDFIVDDDDDDLDYYDKSDDGDEDDNHVDNAPVVRVIKKKPPVQENLLSLTMARSNNIDSHNRYIDCLRQEWVDSAKVSKCMEILAKIQETGEKTIIFSQWNILLDLMHVPIRDMGLGYRCYTGSMTSKHRDEAVSDFSSDPDVKVMLVSLKAGNAGLNLTAASNVIIMDPFWNPFTEMQAIDRTYRIGQMQEVKVHRILIKETVEDRIIKLQTGKKRLVEAALSGNSAKKGASSLDSKDLLFLFGMEDE